MVRSLVGGGGVDEAVAEDDAAALEDGEDDLSDVLDSCGAEEEELGLGEDVLVAEGEEEVADGLAERRAAGFAGGDDLILLFAEAIGDELHLGGLAGALGTLEGDEQSVLVGLLRHGGGGSGQSLRFSRSWRRIQPLSSGSWMSCIHWWSRRRSRASVSRQSGLAARLWSSAGSSVRW